MLRTFILGLSLLAAATYHPMQFDGVTVDLKQPRLEVVKRLTNFVTTAKGSGTIVVDSVRHNKHMGELFLRFDIESNLYEYAWMSYANKQPASVAIYKEENARVEKDLGTPKFVNEEAGLYIHRWDVGDSVIVTNTIDRQTGRFTHVRTINFSGLNARLFNKGEVVK